MSYQPQKKPGFTLVELLVVLGVIGLITTVAVIYINDARARARDTKRVSDAKQVQVALELYARNEGIYPSVVSSTQPLKSTSTVTTYIPLVPSNPTPYTDGGCPALDYYYYTKNNNKDFTWYFCLGKQSGPLNSGGHCLTKSGYDIHDPMCVYCGETMRYDGGRYDVNGTTTIMGGYYRTVQIGDQCWMRDNLNVGTLDIEEDGGSCVNFNGLGGKNLGVYFDFCQLDDTKIEKACKGNIESYCSLYGGSYEWHEAMGLSAYYATNTYTFSAGNTWAPTWNWRGICPPGWHIPSDQDWATMESLLYGATTEYCTTGANDGSYHRCKPPTPPPDYTTPGGLGDMLKVPGNCAGNIPCGTSGFDWLDPGDMYYLKFWDTRQTGARGGDYYSVYSGFGSGGHFKGWNSYLRCVKDN
jgi:uncharacterized protein (TIGR02145 family)/prepilin-type N-terminal cleavage/methylation domain-containing protein